MLRCLNAESYSTALLTQSFGGYDPAQVSLVTIIGLEALSVRPESMRCCTAVLHCQGVFSLSPTGVMVAVYSLQVP